MATEDNSLPGGNSFLRRGDFVPLHAVIAKIVPADDYWSRRHIKRQLALASHQTHHLLSLDKYDDVHLIGHQPAGSLNSRCFRILDDLMAPKRVFNCMTCLRQDGLIPAVLP